MRNILLFSNCNQLNECLEDKLEDTARIAGVKFKKSQQFNNSICSAYDLILIHFSENYYSNALRLVDDLKNLNLHNYVFMIEHLDDIQKEELLQLHPILLLDFTSITKECIYNLKSIIENNPVIDKLNKSNNGMLSPTFNDSRKLNGNDNRLRAINETPFLSSKISKKSYLSKGFAKLKALSKKELEVFYHLLNGKSSKIICMEMCVEASTIATHKSRLFNKLEVNSIADLVHFAYKHKLV